MSPPRSIIHVAESSSGIHGHGSASDSVLARAMLGSEASLPRDGVSHVFLRLWHVTEIGWPSPPAAYDACMANVRELLRHGVRVTGGVDAFDLGSACTRQLGIRDLDSVGLVLWSGAHPRRHDGKNLLLQAELKHLGWSHSQFLAAALDSLSSSLPQATVIACDKGDWANSVAVGLDHKPLFTFKTFFGSVFGSRFHSEASGFDDRHVRPFDTNEFLGCGLIGPFLRPILGQESVDIPELAVRVAEAGLHVVFVGEYTCALSRHCLCRAISEYFPSFRMLCVSPWVELPIPKRRWKRGVQDVYSLQQFRDEASAKVFKRHSADRWPFISMHAASNWMKALPKGRACVSDFGLTMWPAV